MLKENNNLYIMSEFEELTKTIVNIVIIFFVFIILHNAYLYLVEELSIFKNLQEGFDMASVKKANKGKLSKLSNSKANTVKSAAITKKNEKNQQNNNAQVMSGNTSTNGSPGYGYKTGNAPVCLTPAQCVIQQETTENSKVLQSLSQKVDALSQTVSSMHTQAQLNAKNKGISSAKNAANSIPNGPATSSLKQHANDKVNSVT